MVDQRFSRTALLLGESAIMNLNTKCVAIFGLGGVGSYVAEALARSGIGSFILVDHDQVERSNINRQLIATDLSIGEYKVNAIADRIVAINPLAQVEKHIRFFLPDSDHAFLDRCDYIVDAIDTVSAKLDLIVYAQQKKIPIISCMGAGNKLDPTRFQVADIFDTSVCPLCRVMRQELRKRNIDTCKVVYSTEPPITPHQPATDEQTTDPSARKRRQTPGSVSFVPPVAGLIAAGEVVQDLIKA